MPHLLICVCWTILASQGEVFWTWCRLLRVPWKQGDQASQPYHLDMTERLKRMTRMTLLMCCWIHFANFVEDFCAYFVENFCAYVHQVYLPIIFFSCSVLAQLWCQGNAQWSEFESVPSSLLFWMSLRMIDINYLNVWWNSPLKPSDHGLLYVGKF